MFEQPCRGFSLFELLIALAIAALVVGLVAPSLLPSDRLILQTEAKNLVAMLRETRLKAQKTDQPRALIINTEHNSAKIEGAKQASALDPKIKFAVTTAEQEVLGKATAGIRFFPDGSSTGGQIRLRLNQQLLAVDVTWLTGQVKILQAETP